MQENMTNSMTRRDFIKIAGITGGAFVLSSSVASGVFSSMSASQSIDIQGLFSTQRLSNGVEMPVFGFGAYPRMLSKDVDKNTDAILEAINIGYRHIGVYKSESEVGAGLLKSGVAREEIFISLQIDNKIGNDDEFVERFNESLAKLKMNYVDLLSLFFPRDVNDDVLRGKINIWRAMEKLYKDKRVRALGVVNLKYETFNKFLSECDVRPVVNQLFLNPYMFDDRLVDDSNGRKMSVATFVPFGFGSDLLEEPIVLKLAQKYNKTPEQVTLRWSLQKGYITLAGTSDTNKVREYGDVFSFALETKDVKAISRLKEVRKERDKAKMRKERRKARKDEEPHKQGESYSKKQL